MLRMLSVLLLLPFMMVTQANAQSIPVETEVPPDIEQCVTTGLSELWEIELGDRPALFEYFLSNIDVEQFGAYNFKRAWRDWAGNDEIRRLALFEYFDLMMGERGEYEADPVSFGARLADRPLVTGDNVYHIVVRVDFTDGTRTTIVVFTVGCRPFGFVYGGANLRSFVEPNVIERLYRSGKRAPF